jgi:hypothetical protein
MIKVILFEKSPLEKAIYSPTKTTISYRLETKNVKICYYNQNWVILAHNKNTISL